MDTVCGHVEVEEHVSCSCGCAVTPESCNANQQFLFYECRCVCNNHDDRDACLARGWNWSRDTCTCTCPNTPYPACPNNFMFDYLTTCSCIPLHNPASLQLLTLLILTGLGFTSAMLSLLGCYYTKTGLFLRNYQHPSNDEAIIEDQDDLHKFNEDVINALLQQ